MMHAWQAMDPVTVEVGHQIDVSATFEGIKTRYLRFTQSFRPSGPSTEAMWCHRQASCPHCKQSFDVYWLEWPAALVATADYPTLLRYMDERARNESIALFFGAAVLTVFGVGFAFPMLEQRLTSWSLQALATGAGLLSLFVATILSFASFYISKWQTRRQIRIRLPLLFLPLRSKRWRSVFDELTNSTLTRIVVEIRTQSREHFLVATGQLPKEHLVAVQNLKKRFALLNEDEPHLEFVERNVPR